MFLGGFAARCIIWGNPHRKLKKPTWHTVASLTPEKKAGSFAASFAAFPQPATFTKDCSSSHNHGSGKWLYLKGNYYWRGPFFDFHDDGRKGIQPFGFIGLSVSYLFGPVG